MPDILVNVPAAGASVSEARAGGSRVTLYTDAGASTPATLPYALSATSRRTLYVGAVGAYDVTVTDSTGRVLETASGTATAITPLVFVPAGDLAVADASGTYVPLGVTPPPAGTAIAQARSAGVVTPQSARADQVWASMPESGLAPNLMVPPGASLTNSTAAAWYAANSLTALRFHLSHTKTYRYVNLRVGVSSGNIMVGVASVQPFDASTVTLTPVVTSGVIPCPAINDQRIDLGHFTLPPGDYALFLWCDNTTAQFLHGASAGMTASRMIFSAAGLASGLTGAVIVGPTTRWVSGLTLESGQFSTVLLGDSITAAQSWFSYANQWTGYRFSITNKGNPGETTSQILARVNADVIALTPRYCVVLGGANDIGGATSAASIIANLASMYSQITAAGIKVVACTITPRFAGSAGVALAADRAEALRTVNAWIRDNFSNYAGARLCDWAYAMSADGTDESAPLAANLTDNVHPNNTGALVMAPYMRAALSAWV